LSSPQTFFSIPELAERWRCSRGSVYNYLRDNGVKVIDFAVVGSKGKKLVYTADVMHLETRKLKKIA